ncbi:MAG: MopE-related protein [Archangium sp.]
MRTLRPLVILCALVVTSCDCGPPPAAFDPDSGPPQFCSVCRTDLDCGGGRCLSLRGTKVCLGTCNVGSPSCPDGFMCKVPAAGGGAVCTPPDDACCVDLDGDGFGRGMSCAGDDCDDANPAVHRGAMEECNGVDDDCDGEIDDLGVTICGVGACVSAAPLCADGGAMACVPGAPGVETCNGIDDDCNGLADDPPPTTCGQGICAVTVPACTNGSNTPCTPLDAGVESCNTLDDDCDGEVDEGNVSCGVGACLRMVPTCVDGGAVVCEPGDAGTETCNGIDDDCNGMVDDGLGEDRCGVGACEQIVPHCLNGQPNTATCTPGMPSMEVCNNRDDDCNGMVDDGFGTTTCGAGACQRTVQNCMAGAFQTCMPGDAGVEICNGIDDDCNSVPDDGLGTTTCGMGACMRTVQNCAAGMPQTCTASTPMPEVCNGQDDDCNGTPDDGNPGGNASCNTGQPGVCSAGTTACLSGSVQCVANQMPTAEACNGVDDNCDGMTDNAPANTMCPPPVGATLTACINGTGGPRCTITGCTAGLFDVNGTFTDGCECNDVTRNTCSTPFNMGNIGVSQTFTGPLSNVPAAMSSTAPDWYSVNFPPDDSTGSGRGGGTPTIEFAAGTNAAYRFDVITSSCGSPGMCGRGGSAAATGLTTWSFVDSDTDAAASPSQGTANQNGWPSTIYIRVYRTGSTASCATYQLRARRP